MSLNTLSRITQLSERAELNSTVEPLQHSPEAFRDQHSDQLLCAESDELYQFASQARDAALLHEKCLLTRASPLARSAPGMTAKVTGIPLRDYENQFGGRASRYTLPGSVSSMFSPAAYLTSLYRHARQLYAQTSPYHIDVRRPDLKHISLSQQNMSIVEPALGLSNQVLLTQARTVLSVETDEAVLDYLSGWRLSGSTPYHHAHARLRQCLVEHNAIDDALSASPKVAGLFSGAANAGMAFDLPPELVSLLNEPLTGQSYTNNFGTLPPAFIRQRKNIQAHYGLSDEETQALAEELAEPSEDYLNGALTCVVSNKFYRLNCQAISPQVNQMRLYPQSNGSYTLRFNRKVGASETIRCSFRVDDGTSVTLSNHLAALDGGVTYEWVIPPGALPEGRVFHLNLRFSNFAARTLFIDTAEYTIETAASLNIQALKLNKLIRLWRATGLPLQTLKSLLSMTSPENISREMLPLLYQVQRCMTRYRIAADEALVLCGGLLSRHASQGESSQFDRVFNAAQSGEPRFQFSRQVLNLHPDKVAEHPHEKAVLKRALQVDDTQLHALVNLYDSGAGRGTLELSLKHLSRLYALSRWAQLLDKGVDELGQLMQFAHSPALAPGDLLLWAGELQRLDALSGWLATRRWSVHDLRLMVGPALYERTAELVQLFDALREQVLEKPLTAPQDRLALLAPHVAAAFGLPSSAVAASILAWGDALKLEGMTVTQVWTALGSSHSAGAQMAFPFLYGLVQLALIYHASGIDAQAFELVRHSPARLLGGTVAVLPRTLDTVRALSDFAAWLKGLGDAANGLLAHFADDVLVPAKLAEVVSAAPIAVEQAVVQAVKHGQVSQVSKVSNWAELQAVCQWLALGQTLGVSAATLGQWLALSYQVNTAATRAQWTATANAFSAGLKPAQASRVEATLRVSLSAALSGYLLSTELNSVLEKISREGLYHYLLSDNLNGSQVTTSRLAEAITSLQTFIQRTLVAPEGEVNQAVLALPFFTEWERLNQRYSTWAGAAKLIYYPENYLDPTVRLGQTEMMGEMLQALGQSELNADTVGDAFHTYLNGFEEVANLRVISGYHDNLDAREGKTYLIGTNQAEPSEFFWRSVDESKRDDCGQLAANAWTDWRKVGCSPQPWGNCIRPVMHKARLYLCWLEQHDVTPPLANGQPNPVKRAEYALKRAYLRYDGNWSSPKTIEITAPIDALKLGNEAPGLYCSSFQSEATMSVLLYKKQASYPTKQPTNRHLLYIYEDMRVAHQTTAVAANFISHMYLELDTDNQVVMNNAYAQSNQVERGLTRRVGMGDTYILNSLAENTAVVDQLTGPNALLSLDIKLDLSLAPVAPELGALINKVPEIKAAAQFHLYLSGAMNGVICIRHNGHFYVSGSGEMGHCTSFWVNYINGTVRSAQKLQTLVHLDPASRKPYHIGVYRDPHPDWLVGVAESSLKKAIFVDFDGNLSEVAFVPAFGRLSPNPLRNVPANQVTVEFFDGKNRTSFVATGASGELSSGVSGTLRYDFAPMANIPVRKDWGGRSELLVDVYFKVLGQNYARYTLRFYRSAMDVQNVIRLGTTADNAQYMELGAYRTRLNTLFARQLVERAAAGVDTILNYETQHIQEPKLGEGFYTTLTLPKYKPAVHGDEPWVHIYYTYFFTNGDTHKVWSGKLSPDEFTKATIFVPRPANGWAQARAAHLQVSYKKEVNTAASGKSLMFQYDTQSGTAIATRPGTSALSKDIVESVTVHSTLPMDFGGANALYFWELFYYTPMMVAQRLAQEQQFGLADQWLRYVWNPAGYSVGGHLENRFWNVRPLQEDTGWNDAPLKMNDPDAVAQNDPMHYKVATFMRALDLLIMRGDSAYRRLDRDALTEAKGWYGQALNLLGEQAHVESNTDWPEPSLEQAASSAAFSGHLQGMWLLSEGKQTEQKAMVPGGSVHFAPEVNDAMQGYWLTLRQRLFNLRNNLALDGQPLLLPLYAKPADPKALLTAAVAAQGGAGTSLAPVDLPLWRFEPMLANARSMVNQLIQFGHGVQGVLERKDAESLSALLQNQGLELMGSSVRLQESVQEELDGERAVILQTLLSAQQRLASYTQLYEQNVNAGERFAMNALSASQAMTAGAKINLLAAAAADLMPNIFGLAAGGSKYGGVSKAVGIGITLAADATSASGHRILQEEAYRRRREEWEIQRNSAQGEVQQLEAQLSALDVRRESARLQAAYLNTQQRQLRTGLDFLQSKFSNVALYSWMRGRLAAIYFQFYDLTASRCLMAERAWQWESGDSRTFIRGGGWQSTWAGLTCGEGLMLNLAQLEAAQMKIARRALEVTRTVSLAELYRSDKLAQADRFELGTALAAMIAGTRGEAGSVANGLRLDGGDLIARISLAALAIAADYPAGLGARRRIKQVRVSLPALLGPYQNIQAVMNYSGGAPLPPGCDRMALSQGLNDSGMFQADYNDSRWLPFEGANISEGQLALRFPHARGKQQDVLKTLGDIVLHVDYTILP